MRCRRQLGSQRYRRKNAHGRRRFDLQRREDTLARVERRPERRERTGHRRGGRRRRRRQLRSVGTSGRKGARRRARGRTGFAHSSPAGCSLLRSHQGISRGRIRCCRRGEHLRRKQRRVHGHSGYLGHRRLRLRHRCNGRRWGGDAGGGPASPAWTNTPCGGGAFEAADVRCSCGTKISGWAEREGPAAPSNALMPCREIISAKTPEAAASRSRSNSC
jgi:hypothetical protein